MIVVMLVTLFLILIVIIIITTVIFSLRICKAILQSWYSCSLFTSKRNKQNQRNSSVASNSLPSSGIMSEREKNKDEPREWQNGRETERRNPRATLHPSQQCRRPTPTRSQGWAGPGWAPRDDLGGRARSSAVTSATTRRAQHSWPNARARPRSPARARAAPPPLLAGSRDLGLAICADLVCLVCFWSYLLVNLMDFLFCAQTVVCCAYIWNEGD